jgi:3-hydroxyacyl-CoA dehydrogenase/3a,7a,12a-trihydroxy-5b-cholest-24-enoyl-CoA hydratase
VEDGLAQMSGFPRAINHGLSTLGQSVRVVLKEALGNDPAQFKAVRARYVSRMGPKHPTRACPRFASPVLPGQTLQVKMWIEGSKVLFTTTAKETGKVAINNAYVLAVGKPKL